MHDGNTRRQGKDECFEEDRETMTCSPTVMTRVEIKQSDPKGPSRYNYQDTKDRSRSNFYGRRKTKTEADEILSSSCIGNLRGGKCRKTRLTLSDTLYTYTWTRVLLPSWSLRRQRLLPSCCRRDWPREESCWWITDVHDGWSVDFQFRARCLYVERVEQQRRSRCGTTLVVCYSGIREEEGVGVVQRQMHSLVLCLKMLALVHGQAAGSATEAVALRAKLAGVADFAKQLALVLGAVCRVEQFAAKTCNTRSSSVVGNYGTSCWMYSSFEA